MTGAAHVDVAGAVHVDVASEERLEEQLYQYWCLSLC